MAESPYWPVFGLPLAEWQAALRAMEPILARIDDRLIEARVRKDGSLDVKTGEVLGGLDGRGHRLWLRKTECDWVVAEIVEWAS